MALKNATREEEFAVTLATTFYDESEEVYLMANNPRGFCVIFNNNMGKNESGFKERDGSQSECKSLISVFNQLHFKVKVRENRTAKQIDVICSDLSKKDELVNHIALVVIFLSHGSDGYVSGVDGNQVELETLFAYFNADNCESLANKPKVFFVSACRGNKRDRILDNVVPNSDARHLRAAWSDMLIVYSTTPGYVSYSLPDLGTWLGSTLARALAQYAHEKPLRDIIDIVDREISKKYTNDKINGELIPCMQSPNSDNLGFKRKLYLNP